MRCRLTLPLQVLSALLASSSLAQGPQAFGDSSLAAREARAHLRALVRLDTSNPPGRERPAADYLREQLALVGIPADLYPFSGTRASLWARLKGAGSKRPIMLVCHLDVVPAERSQWSVDPFAAVERDGYLYGRGAADDKSMCAAELAVIADLKRSGAVLDRDVIFFAAADEESGAEERHVDRLVRERPELFDAEYAVNEGGVTSWENGRVAEMQVQVAEKDFLDVTLTARGRPGHSAVPAPDNAAAALLRAANRLAEARFPAELQPVTREFLRFQAESAALSLRRAMEEVLVAAPGADLDRAADRLEALNPEFSAFLRDTLTPTMLRAGYKSNVAPGLAQAVFNARLMPGRDAAGFLARLRVLAREPSVEISAAVSSGVPAGSAVSTAMPLDSELWRAVMVAAPRFAPGARVVPFLSPWSTDSRQLRGLGVLAYGIAPPLSREDGARVHGKDERLLLAGLDWYVEFLRELVLAVAGGRRGEDEP